MKVAGQVCWVSGAFQGIGLEVVKLLVREGGNVVMVDIAEASQGAALAEKVSLHGPGKAKYVRADLSKGIQVYQAMQKPKEIFGQVASIVIGNAGIVVKDDDPRVTSMIELNTTAVILASQLAANLMKQAGIEGCIINTASMAGVTPVVMSPAYAASKWAIVGYTLSLKPMQKTHKVRVNCVCPTLVGTPAVGEFFKTEFLKEKQGSVTRGLADKALDAKYVASVFMKIIDDDALVASAVLVTPEKTLVHNPNFNLTLGQAFDTKVPNYMANL